MKWILCQKKPWLDALNYVAEMNANGGLCSKTDWCLPSIVELGLLPNKEKADSATWLNTQGWYSSPPPALITLEHAWRVRMNFDYWLGSGKLVNAYGWPVRN